MKKLLALFLVVSCLLTMASGVLAWTTISSEKQLLVDGDMEVSGTGSWTATTATLSKETSSPKSGKRVIRVTYSGTSAGAAAQVVFVTGKKYRVTGWQRGDGTSAPHIYDASGAGLCVGTSSTAWQRCDTTFVAGSTGIRLRSSTLSAGTYVEFDDVMVTEYKGAILNGEKQLVTDGDMERYTTSSWSVYAGALVEKDTVNPVSGKRSLKLVSTVTTQTRVIQNVLTAGKRFHITGWARSDGTRIPSLYGQTSGNEWTGTNSTSWQRFDFISTQIPAGLFSTRLLVGTLSTGSVSDYTEWDDLMVTEYRGSIINQEKQLITDGDMEKSGTTNWSASQSGSATATLSKVTGVGGKNALRIANSGGGAGNIWGTQNASMTTGKLYKIRGKARGDGTHTPTARFWPTVTWTGTNSTAWQTFEVTGAAGGNTLYLGATTVAAAGYVEFDEIFVTSAQ
jgi:hypothetical protein